jgi:N-acetyl-gamma-glutamyl-phosphate reductase
MVKVAIIGASGYTGAESIEIILRHEHAELVCLSALPQECGPLEKVFPQFDGRCGLPIEPLDIGKLSKAADVALCCLPHKVSMGFVPKILDAGLKVIDFSADYRLTDPQVYKKFYEVEHSDVKNLKRAVYGLPELYREQIAKADLVANPGCFPTGALLVLAPLLKSGAVDTGGILVNAVTGISGAGKSPSGRFHYPNMNENIFAYGIGCHRHLPEIEQIAGDLAGGKVEVIFQPHAGPFDRGILSTVYCRPKEDIDASALRDLYDNYYRGERFIRIRGECPGVKDVARTNYCHIFATCAGGWILGFSAIDNLTRGASGQAVQNMNIAFGLDETEALG